ncbi:hypothetical protein BGZ63DRAFT_176746 [Mariannaea sp. PMI_226]|nr:hypothetical protein BGZ63DRAFT_176746 [Mariannaea sp. PMI_226]
MISEDASQGCLGGYQLKEKRKNASATSVRGWTSITAAGPDQWFFPGDNHFIPSGGPITCGKPRDGAPVNLGVGLLWHDPVERGSVHRIPVEDLGGGAGGEQRPRAETCWMKVYSGEDAEVRMAVVVVERIRKVVVFFLAFGSLQTWCCHQAVDT